MVQWLRTLTALPGDLGSTLNIHMVAHNCLKCQVPGDPMPSPHLHRHKVYKWCMDIHAGKNAHRHKIKDV